MDRQASGDPRREVYEVAGQPGALVVFLSHDSVAVRLHALTALGEVGATAGEHASVVAPHIRAEHFGERAAAVQALGRLGSGLPAIVAGLVEALDDPELIVRRRAIGALGSLQAEVACEQLTALVRDEALGQEAIEALGKVESPKAVPALLDVLRGEGDKNAVLIALGRIGDPAAMGAIFDAAAKGLDGIEEARADQALRQLATVEQLAEVLAGDPRDAVRMLALRSLDRGPVSRKAMITALATDPHTRVRANCAYYLGYCMDDPEVVSAMRAALADPHEDVHHFAQQALAKLERQ